MRPSTSLALCAAVAGASALQFPFLWPEKEAPSLAAGETKPLVDSEELQDLVSGERLLAGAKKLFEVAKLSEDEYNHPTRVIGSAGKMVT